MKLVVSNVFSSPFKKLNRRTLVSRSAYTKVRQLSSMPTTLWGASPFFLPKRRNSFALLNAPYRYKLSQTHLGQVDVRFVTKTSLPVNFVFGLRDDLVNYLLLARYNRPRMETNIVLLRRSRLVLKSVELKNFYSI